MAARAFFVGMLFVLPGCGSCGEREESPAASSSAASPGDRRPFRVHWDGGRHLYRRHQGDGGADGGQYFESVSP